jgi:hypothetical protein
MQPLVEEILETARSKDESVRLQGLVDLQAICDLQYCCRSYEERVKSYGGGGFPEKYLSIYLFDDEWGKIAYFLSRLFIDDYSEASRRVIYCLKSLGADALEPLLDILIEAPEKLDKEPMKLGFEGGTYEIGQTLYELMVEGRYKSGREFIGRPSGEELTRLLKDTSLLPFLTKLSESDLAEKPNKRKLKEMLLWAESELMWKRTNKELKKLLKAKSPVPFFKRWAASDDPNTAEEGLYWLNHLKENYGIVK